MDKKAKKKIQTLNQRIQKLRQQLAGARKQADDPRETAELEQQMSVQIVEPELAGGGGVLGQGSLDGRQRLGMIALDLLLDEWDARVDGSPGVGPAGRCRRLRDRRQGCGEQQQETEATADTTPP